MGSPFKYTTFYGIRNPILLQPIVFNQTPYFTLFMVLFSVILSLVLIFVSFDIVSGAFSFWIFIFFLSETGHMPSLDRLDLNEDSNGDRKFYNFLLSFAKKTTCCILVIFVLETFSLRETSHLHK